MPDRMVTALSAPANSGCGCLAALALGEATAAAAYLRDANTIVAVDFVRVIGNVWQTNRAVSGPRTAEAIVPAIEPDDRYPERRPPQTPTDVAASECRQSSSGTGAGRITRALVGSRTCVCALRPACLGYPGGHRLLLRVRAAVRRDWCSSSGAQATVGPSLAPAFLTEQQRRR